MKITFRLVCLFIVFFIFIPVSSPNEKQRSLADMMPENMRADWSGPLKTTTTLYLKRTQTNVAFLTGKPKNFHDPIAVGPVQEIPEGTKVYIDEYINTGSTEYGFIDDTSTSEEYAIGHFEDGTKFKYRIKFFENTRSNLFSYSSNSSYEQGFYYVFVPLNWYEDYVNATDKAKKAMQHKKVIDGMNLRQVVMSMGPPSKITPLDEFGVNQYTFRSIYYYFDKDDKLVQRPKGLKENKRPKQP